MKKIRYMMLSLMAAMLMAMPMQAQNVTNDEVVEMQETRKWLTPQC